MRTTTQLAGLVLLLAGSVTINMVSVPAAAQDRQASGVWVTEADQPDRHRPAPPPAPQPDRNQNLEDRLRRLEDQLRRLAERLERLEPAPEHDHPIPAPQPPAPPVPPTPHPGQGPRPAPRPDREAGELVARPYHLSEGKLQALTALMVRPDVPILVEPREDHLVVHATPHHHEIIAAFIRLLEPQPAPDPIRGGHSERHPATDPESEKRMLREWEHDLRDQGV